MNSNWPPQNQMTPSVTDGAALQHLSDSTQHQVTIPTYNSSGQERKATGWSCPRNIYGITSTDATTCLDLSVTKGESSSSSLQQSQQWKAVLVCANGIAGNILPNGQEDLDSNGTCEFYFEVTVQCGRLWIGFVPAFSRVPADNVSANEFLGVTTDQQQHNNATHHIHPYDIILNKFPGSCVGSIGLGSDGNLCMNGQLIHQHQVAASSLNEGNLEINIGDVMGCGLSYDRIFFTLNGVIIRSDDASSMGLSGSTVLCPGIGLDMTGPLCSNTANFGATPFRWSASARFASSPEPPVPVPIVETSTPALLVDETADRSGNLNEISTQNSTQDDDNNVDLEEKTKELVRLLSDALSYSASSPSSIRELTGVCKAHQQSVQAFLQRDNGVFNFSLFDACLALEGKIKEAAEFLESANVPKYNRQVSESSTHGSAECVPATDTLDDDFASIVQGLEIKQDVLSLMCMLRDPSGGGYDAAKALFRIVKRDVDLMEQSHGGVQGNHVCDAIRYVFIALICFEHNVSHGFLCTS